MYPIDILLLAQMTSLCGLNPQTLSVAIFLTGILKSHFLWLTNIYLNLFLFVILLLFIFDRAGFSLLRLGFPLVAAGGGSFLEQFLTAVAPLVAGHRL